MYGVRVLNVSERTKAANWKLYDVAIDIEKDVEEQAPTIIGETHFAWLENRKLIERLPWIKSLKQISDDDKDKLIKQASAIGSILTLQPNCKLNERMKQRLIIPENCIDDARRITICMVFENGKRSKRFTSSH